MKVVFIKNNDNLEYENLIKEGYKFLPRRKNIKSLLVINTNMIKDILNKKVYRDIKKVDKTIKLIINSNVAISDDCIMMEKELIRIIKNIENKYIRYFDEFEYFDFIKNIYILNMVIILKKKLIINEGV